MENVEIIEKIRHLLAEEFETDIELIRPDALLMDTLNMDSLDLVDMVVLLDQNFGIKMAGKDFVGIKTFQNLYDLLIAKINEQ